MKILIPAFALFLTLSGCGESASTTPAPPPAAETKSTETWEYVCVHKCEGGHSHEPGKCPACGMPLVAAASLNTDNPAAPATDHSHSH